MGEFRQPGIHDQRGTAQTGLLLLQPPVILAGWVVDVGGENPSGDASLNLRGVAVGIDVRHDECSVRSRVEADCVISQHAVGKRQHVAIDVTDTFSPAGQSSTGPLFNIRFPV
jgi:hypothetical protein